MMEFPMQHIILLACSLALVDSVILGRRKSSSSWSWGGWNNGRRSSWNTEPEPWSRWDTKSTDTWGWNYGNQNQWGAKRGVDTWTSNSDYWNSDNRWANNRRSDNSWKSWNSWSGSSWGRQNQQRSRTRTSSHTPTTRRSSSGNNAWYYQMICKNNYAPLTQSNGSPFYCSWYRQCPQNGGTSYWYSYRYTCQTVGEGSMGLCCVDAGELTPLWET
ncbi:bifunctional endo-1,4-beta-xylanase XylA-like isoform X2 [Haliotis rufescens]|uniref:bifunctional endo-1,4-beta-xylanase XylA-like isoform X2 n=1 Tax=Haliotis rufescens TaxID=6454 RepID=UPI00201F1FED|nr:bifunctional endo-1,4-beta-xylanase XylA-like isoform X2 [Haliotis rufescens]